MFLLMIIGLMLIFIILLQRGRGGGLAGALGGMGGQSAFGTKAGDMFTRITIGLAAVWMIVAVGNIYALQYTGKIYDGGSEAAPSAPALEKPPGDKLDSTADENAKKAAHSLMNIGDKPDAATEDTKPAVDTNPEDKKADDATPPATKPEEPAAEKKADEPKPEPAKEEPAKPAEKTEEKTDKPAEPEAKPDEKKPE
jgi:preprotein translocase subunit SecG